jgi:hypothetical protein
MGLQPGGVASPVAGPVSCPYADPDTGNTTMKKIIFVSLMILVFH